MSISANTLFHFTRKKDDLKSILKNAFYPKYGLEDLSNVIPESQVLSAHIPMISFCDLRLSQTKEHLEFYGDYGIGLEKNEWGKRNGISPVIYVPKESISATHIQSILKEIKEIFLKKNGKNVFDHSLPDFFKYIKASEGNATNRMTKEWQFRNFYDEREWRYSPNGCQVLPEKVDKKVLAKEDKRMQKENRLTFSTNDINYIIVKEKEEILEFLEFLVSKEVKGFKKEERHLLMSKLISVEQIRKDM